MRIKKLISKALCLTIAATMLSVATPPNFVNDSPATVHAETLYGAYKWDVNGNITEIPGGTSASDFSDSVFGTFEKISYDSICRK